MAQSPLNCSPSYLCKTPYSYCFRIRIPWDLQDRIGKKELRYSLKTGYLPEAKSKARLMAGQVQRLFRHMRKGTTIMTGLSTEERGIKFDKNLESHKRLALELMIKKVSRGLENG